MFTVSKLAYTTYISTLHRYTHTRAKWLRFKEALQCFQTHTKTSSHMDTQGGIQREREGPRSKIQTQRETPALTQEETRPQSDLHTPTETDSYRKKGKQRCRKHHLYTKTEHAKGVSWRKQSKRTASV